MDILAFIISLVGAAAWIPAIINLVQIKKRKVDGTIVDYRILTSGKAENATRTEKKEGTILMLGINFFISYESFFVRDYEINVKLKNGGNLKGVLVDGRIEEKTADGERVFSCPQEYNFNLHREIITDKDNIRIVSMIVQSANFSTKDEIGYIEFIFKNNMFGNQVEKSVKFTAEDFPKFNHMGLINGYFRSKAQLKTIQL